MSCARRCTKHIRLAADQNIPKSHLRVFRFCPAVTYIVIWSETAPAKKYAVFRILSTQWLRSAETWSYSGFVVGDLNHGAVLALSTPKQILLLVLFPVLLLLLLLKYLWSLSHCHCCLVFLFETQMFLSFIHYLLRTNSIYFDIAISIVRRCCHSFVCQRHFVLSDGSVHELGRGVGKQTASQAKEVAGRALSDGDGWRWWLTNG